MNRQKVLIVDDQQVNLLLLKSALKSVCETSTASSGAEALKILSDGELPDLILLDVMMPEMSGFDLCRIIKSDRALAGVPVIFVTAMDSDAGQNEGLGLGAIDYITKPFNLDLVKLRVKNHLELKQRSALIERQRDLLVQRTTELEEALSRIKTLEGIIPICMYCKKIRNETESWEQLEAYLTEHTDALFSHGICPDCQHERFPD